MVRFVLCACVLALAGCAKEAAVKEVSVAQVAELAKTGAATICDANVDEYRDVVGVVPGAVLLSNFNEYDVATTLPADKSRPLVFYCTSRG